jgi:hypothetical protein
MGMVAFRIDGFGDADDKCLTNYENVDSMAASKYSDSSWSAPGLFWGIGK